MQRDPAGTFRDSLHQDPGRQREAKERIYAQNTRGTLLQILNDKFNLFTFQDLGIETSCDLNMTAPHLERQLRGSSSSRSVSLRCNVRVP